MSSSNALALVCIAAHVLTLTARVLITLDVKLQILYLLPFLLPAHHLAAALLLLSILIRARLAYEDWPVSWPSVTKQVPCALHPTPSMPCGTTKEAERPCSTTALETGRKPLHRPQPNALRFKLYNFTPHPAP